MFANYVYNYLCARWQAFCSTAHCVLASVWNSFSAFELFWNRGPCGRISNYVLLFGAVVSKQRGGWSWRSRQPGQGARVMKLYRLGHCFVSPSACLAPASDELWHFSRLKTTHTHSLALSLCSCHSNQRICSAATPTFKANLSDICIKPFSFLLYLISFFLWNSKTCIVGRCLVAT